MKVYSSLQVTIFKINANASSKCTVQFLKIKANKGLQSTVAEHRLASLIILSIKNEGALYIDYQFIIEDSMALEAQRIDFGC